MKKDYVLLAQLQKESEDESQVQQSRTALQAAGY